MQAEGISPRMTCLAVIEGNGYEAESWWIQKFKSLGFDLTNAHVGGQGGNPGTKQSTPKIISQEQRDRIRKTLTGRKVGFAIRPFIRTADTEARRISASIKAKKGTHLSPEVRERIRESNKLTYKERPHSEEHREKISRSSKLWWDSMSPEQRKEAAETVRLNTKKLLWLAIVIG